MPSPELAPELESACVDRLWWESRRLYQESNKSLIDKVHLARFAVLAVIGKVLELVIERLGGDPQDALRGE
jgi:hypothetical protein